LYYYDAEFDGNLLTTGSNYSTFLQQTDTVWVESVENNLSQYLGPLNNSFGTGGQHNNATTQYMIFTVNEPLTIVSAWVNAGAAGDRTITLWDASGNQLDSRFLNIPAGGSRISLNFHVEPGVNYRIGGAQMNLYRNNAGAVFPYQIPGLVSITGSSAGGAFYYYFYDWEVVKDPCISPRTPVQLIMDEVTASATVNTLGMTATVSANNCLNANQYAWDFGDNNTSNGFSPSHTYSVPGLYTVTLVASNANCSDTTTFEVIADNASLTELNGNNWLLYPNPANEGLNIEFTYGIAQSVSIVDAAGRVVLECPILCSLSYLNISGLARGTYRVVASFGDGTKSVKPFVKQD
jgi:hypothetical protein